GAEGAGAEEREAEEGELAARGVVGVGEQEDEGEGDEEEFFTEGQGVLAEDLEDVGEDGDAGAEEDEAGEVDGLATGGAEVGHVQVGHDEAEQADGDIDEEDGAPVEPGDDGT